MRIIYLIFAIALLVGCKPTPGITPTKLAHQIADTDHIIATYYHRTGHVPPEISEFSITITGDDARQIVRAISQSTSDGTQTLCMPEWELQFYKGTNRLAAVGFGCSLVWVNRAEFRDESGTLEKLDHAIYAQTRRLPVPTNGTIGPLSTY